MAASMECHCLRFSQLPRTTKLFAAFVENFDRVREFYAEPPEESAVIRSARAAAVDEGTRRAVVEVLREQNREFGADAATEKNLDRLLKGAAAIVTGQQVGLFAGPAYSFYKALSVARWAERLTQRGIEAVPVFWMATEDHDLAEVNHCFWTGPQGLARLELETGSATGRHVGELLLGSGISSLVEKAVLELEGPDALRVGEALRAAYRPEETFGSAFAKLMARILRGRGIILLDPLDPRLHRLARSVYARAAEEAEELTQELMARNKALEQRGFHAQVKVMQQSTLLFCDVEGRREPLRRRNTEYVAGPLSFTKAELLNEIEKSPARFTANVLLRSVVQDALLPTAAYVAGPAEVAYYAQSEVLYRRILGRMPPILPRASFTLVTPSVARVLRRYGIELEDTFRGRQHIRAKLERQFLSPGLARRFEADEKALRRTLRAYRRPLGRLDKTLLGALDTSERKMLYQFLKLRGKAGRAEDFRAGILRRQERQLLDSLYPHRGLQERSLSLVPFLAAQGRELLDALEEKAAPAHPSHRVLYL